MRSLGVPFFNSHIDAIDELTTEENWGGQSPGLT